MVFRKRRMHGPKGSELRHDTDKKRPLAQAPALHSSALESELRGTLIFEADRFLGVLMRKEGSGIPAENAHS